MEAFQSRVRAVTCLCAKFWSGTGGGTGRGHKPTPAVAPAAVAVQGEVQGGGTSQHQQ